MVAPYSLDNPKSPQQNLVVAIGRNQQKLQDVPASDHLVCDATDAAGVAQALDDVKARHGRLDGVANAVGDLLSKSLLTTTDEEIMHTLQVNLISSLNIVRPAVRVMSSTPDGGSIALISAAAARFGLPNYDVFAAAKVRVLVGGCMCPLAPSSCTVVTTPVHYSYSTLPQGRRDWVDAGGGIHLC